ncbi:unnamed protein product [Enterobius vermicularis]|uniref:Paired domain-containing protein n=1 Tax=Enterobius vermicularis TaxID=51028 RepID=A0A0N4VPH1_ENTVE|nr:unnamed protein product [Enterobius vermicularis]
MGTNLYGRFYCPGRPLDMGVREEIIRLFQQNMKVNQISKILKISHGCVSKIIKRYKLTGNVSPASSPEQRRPRRTKKSVVSTAAGAPKTSVSEGGNSESCLKSMPYQQYSLQKSYSFQ